MPRRSPARGPGRTDRKKAPAAVAPGQPQASGTAMDKEEMRRRLRRVAQGFDDPEIPQAIRRQLRDKLRQMTVDIGAQFAPLIAKAIEEDQAEYSTATGQVLPNTLDDMDEIIIQARMAGFTAAEAEAGEYTLAAIHRQAVAAKRLRDLQHPAGIHEEQNQTGEVAEAPRRESGKKKSRGRGGHNKKPITGWITTIAESWQERDGKNPVDTVIDIRSLGDTPLRDLIFEELGKRVSARTISRWRQKQAESLAPPSAKNGGGSMDDTDGTDAESRARRDDATRSLRTCTRIDGRTSQAEEPSQSRSRRHLREQADKILEDAGCPMPLK